MDEKIGFEKFLFNEDANYLQQLLHQNGISTEMELPKTQFDAIVGHNRANEYFILKIAQQQFDAALQIIENDLKEKGIPADYHLHQMDVGELMEILEHPDQWSRFDVAAAKILLAEKGIGITNQKTKVLTTAREDYLKSQRTIENPNFVLLMIISAFSFFFAIIGGLMIYRLKQTNMNGEKDYVFSKEGRNRGLAIAIIGVLSTVGWYYFIKRGY